MIDVKVLIAKYSVDELNEAADQYYKSCNTESLLSKPFRLPEVKHLLTEVSSLAYGLDLRPGDQVLDFGCGIGWTSRILHSCGCHVVGTDVSPTALSIARQMSDRWMSAMVSASTASLTYVPFDGYRLSVADCSIDKIFVLDAFHHVPDQSVVLREFARILKPGGAVGMCEPGPSHSTDPASQREMAAHTVVENDIVLSDILGTARQFGFDDLRVCLTPLLPVIVSYEDYASFPENSNVAHAFLEATNHRVKNYPIFFLTKAGKAEIDSRSNQHLKASLELLSDPKVRTNQAYAEITILAKNIGLATWLPSGPAQGAVNIGFSLTRNGETRFGRAHLSSHPIPAGGDAKVSFRIDGLADGIHEVEIDLVAEHIAWFKDVGTSPIRMRVAVAPQ